MRRVRWAGKLLAILGIALAAAAGAAALPDNPYQRWQLIEHTLYANATWAYERIVFDPAPIDVAILGSSRAQFGLGAPEIAAQLARRGPPLTVANLAVVEDGRNLEWAIADRLFAVKRPRVLVVVVSETPNLWGHPGFRYVAPAAAVAWPPAPFLHNSLADLAYLPYRQLELFGAALAPRLFGLRDRFDPAAYAAKPDDYTVSRTLADGKTIDMDAAVSAEDLRAEATHFAATRHASQLPAVVRRITDRDSPVYLTRIAALARAHDARLIFVFVPEFGSSDFADRDFYARLGRVADFGDLARDPGLYQSFAHLNRRGATLASDRVAAVIAESLGPAGPMPDKATPAGGTGA